MDLECAPQVRVACIVHKITKITQTANKHKNKSAIASDSSKTLLSAWMLFFLNPVILCLVKHSVVFYDSPIFKSAHVISHVPVNHVYRLQILKMKNSAGKKQKLKFQRNNTRNGTTLLHEWIKIKPFRCSENIQFLIKKKNCYHNIAQQ